MSRVSRSGLDMVESATNLSQAWLAALYPDGEWQVEMETILPEFIPEPCRSLLYHDDNMTPTLSKFCRAKANLHVLRMKFDSVASVLSRIVTLDCSNNIVELSSIKIYLKALPEFTHERILSGEIPLGTMLIETGISQHCVPDCFLKIPCDSVLKKVFETDSDPYLFGRRNRLVSDDKQVIAELIEIIPGPKRLQHLQKT